jgi:hypothetical protein
MNSQIQVFIDLPKMTQEMAERSVQLTAVFIRNFARDLVRKDTYNLMNSIRANQIRKDRFEVLAGGPGIPYALAQEYGRPDLANYGFTPYMRPAAAVSQKDPETRANILRATREALRASRVNRTIRF